MNNIPDWVYSLPPRAGDSIIRRIFDTETAMATFEYAANEAPNDIKRQEALSEFIVARRRWCTFTREPIPGQVDLPLLTQVIAQTQEYFNEDGTELLWAWIHPSTWAQLAQLGHPGVNDTPEYSRDGQTRNLVIYPGTDLAVDELQVIPTDLSTRGRETRYVSPGFLAGMPGGAEVYEKLRKGGKDPHRAAETTVDTLWDSLPYWEEEWFGEDGAKPWMSVVFSTSREAGRLRTKARQAADILTGRLTPEFTQVEARKAVDMARKTEADILANWDFWWKLVKEPVPCSFNIQEATIRIKQAAKESENELPIFCSPNTYAQLAREGKLDLNSQGGHSLPLGKRDSVPLSVSQYADEDTVELFKIGAGEQNLYLPPENLDAAAKETYVYARTEGMSVSDAVACASYVTGGNRVITTTPNVPKEPETAVHER